VALNSEPPEIDLMPTVHNATTTHSSRIGVSAECRH